MITEGGAYMTTKSMLVYEVQYVDDWNDRHILFVTAMEDIKFLQKRFDNVTFTILTHTNFLIDNFTNF